MIRTLFFGLLIASSICFSELKPLLRNDFGSAAKNSAVENIDAIYLINLDDRKEKLDKTLKQLEPYGISPYRFSAILGWAIPDEDYQNVGMLYQSGMAEGKWVYTYSSRKDAPEEELLTHKLDGKRVLCHLTTPGGVGCTLSHLSVMQNALDQGYERIWILEDDISVQDNPHLLGSYVQKLDDLVGKEGWDILHTGFDIKNSHSYRGENDFLTGLKGAPHLWRPDIDFSNQDKLHHREILNEDFVKIGSRMQTCSMILSRTGMQKILDFYNENHIFMPYDLELSLVPDINIMTLRDVIVSDMIEVSDTQIDQFSPRAKWNRHRQVALVELSKMWQGGDMALASHLMDLVHEHQPKKCVEIGSFGGAFTLPIARALMFDNVGTLFALDAWEKEAALEGVSAPWDRKKYASLNYDHVYENFQTILAQTKIDEVTRPIPLAHREAAERFEEESIDFLFFNELFSETQMTEAVSIYLPKVAVGGMICVLRGEAPYKGPAIGQLMRECEWQKDLSRNTSCVVFKKTQATEKPSIETPAKAGSRLIQWFKNKLEI